MKSKCQVKYLDVELNQFLLENCIAKKIVGKSIAKPKFLYRQVKQFDMATRTLLLSSSAIWIMPAQHGIQGCPKELSRLSTA